MKDIPLINESINYAKKIDSAVRFFNFSRLGHKKITNLIHKYDESFLLFEKKEFLLNPSEYQNSKLINREVKCDEFFYSAIGKKLLLRVIIKFLLHKVFRFLGMWQKILLDRAAICLIRKVYVDDVDGLFEEPKVNAVWFVYPFPLNFFRQYRYIKALRSDGRRYVFSGVPYLLADFLALLRSPTYFRLYKMEARGQIKHALEMTKYKKLNMVQCAEEYDLGSLDFSLVLRRKKINVHNCAHGAGKYLPYHFYSKFEMLTDAQKEYYDFFNDQNHSVRRVRKNKLSSVNFDDKKVIVLLGQASKGVSGLIKEDEIKILNLFHVLSKEYKDIVFAYKKHPNSESYIMGSDSDIRLLDGVLVEGVEKNILQMSLFSTCQVDPNFIGKKILIETEFIKPYLAFGGYEPIVKLVDLKKYLLCWIKNENDE